MPEAGDPVIQEQRRAAGLLLHLDGRILGEDLLGQAYPTSVSTQQDVAFGGIGLLDMFTTKFAQPAKDGIDHAGSPWLRTGLDPFHCFMKHGMIRNSIHEKNLGPASEHGCSYDGLQSIPGMFEMRFNQCDKREPSHGDMMVDGQCQSCVSR